MSKSRTTYVIAAAAALAVVTFSIGGVRDVSATTLSDILEPFGQLFGASVGPTVAAAGPTGDASERDPRISSAIRHASEILAEANRVSVDSIGCPLLTRGVPAARRAWRRGNHQEAVRLLTRALRQPELTCPDKAFPKRDSRIRWKQDLDLEATSKKPQRDGSNFWEIPTSDSPLRDQARLLRARIRLDDEIDDPKGALSDLKAISETTPVDDYILHLEAKAHRRLDRPGRAADRLDDLYDEYPMSPLRWEARTREAMLRVEAGQPKRAIPICNRLLELFPDHPRRFRLLYYRALAHQKAGRLADAAHAYQRTWLAFPHKPEGELARARFERLESFGIEIPSISDERLLDRYRDLRINKHWELAGILLRDLLEANRTESGHSAIEHRIWFELGMNAYTPQYFQKALPWFQRLRRAYDDGHRDGIESNVIDKYLERTYGKLGRIEEALATIDRRLASSSEFVRIREKAELLEDHMRYEEAYRLLKTIYSDWAKRRWQFTWLLYKTGRLGEAAENFRDMIGRRHGTGEQQARYWLARTLERRDDLERARSMYAVAVREDPDDYYGILAASRLHDMKRREAVSDAITRRTNEIVGGSDDVLAALETAADEMEDERRRTPAADETMIPRGGGMFQSRPSGESWSARDCRTGPMATRRRCHLAAGNLPMYGESIIDQLLLPDRGLTGLSFGSIGGLMFLESGNHLSAEPATGERHLGRSTTDQRSPGDVVSLSIDRARRRAMNDAARSAFQIQWHTPAHVYWRGRKQGPPVAGTVPGPVPTSSTAYDGHARAGSLSRAVEIAGSLLPHLRRSAWLHEVGFEFGARDAARQATLEFRQTVQAEAPQDEEPIKLETRRWVYLIDHRPYQEGFWSYTGDEVRRFPVPESKQGKRKLVARQRTMQTQEHRLREVLIDALMEVGDFHMVRQLTAERHSHWYTTAPTGAAKSIWRQMHPRAFANRVIPAAKRQGLNPYMVWSLMGVESAFNPDSVSRAEAIGLLQVIPRTGIKVAAWLGDDDFGPYDLIEPPTAIQHGTSYFGSLVEKFRGQILLAIIGYNAGPHRVRQWLEQRGAQPLDEFVEEVPFAQARGYVRKVTGYLKTYLTLYEGERNLYIGQRLDRNAEFYPNF